jgi:hypothetical protein
MAVMRQYFRLETELLRIGPYTIAHILSLFVAIQAQFVIHMPTAHSRTARTHDAHTLLQAHRLIADFGLVVRVLSLARAVEALLSKTQIAKHFFF